MRTSLQTDFSSRPRLYHLGWSPMKTKKMKVLWMEPGRKVDLFLCKKFMEDAVRQMDKVSAPIDIVLDLTKTQEYSPNCANCFTLPIFKSFNEHPHLHREIYINPPPFVLVLLQLFTLFSQKPVQVCKTANEAHKLLAYSK